MNRIIQIGTQLELDWFIYDCFTRPLASIEASVGRELKMLASHWSRGPPENFHRGYPYDPDFVPIERFWPQMALDWFISAPG